MTLSYVNYQSGYDQIKLRTHGDPVEQDGCKRFNLDRIFPHYEVFWRKHVVPATNRPIGTDFLPNAVPEIRLVAQINYSLFLNLYHSQEVLEEIRAGKLGGLAYRNCHDCIKASGDAIQKFTELQCAISGPSSGLRCANSTWLAQRLGHTVTIFTATEWTTFAAEREEKIGYRNYLTHRGQPPVTLVEGPFGTIEPYVPIPENILRTADVRWASAEFDYPTAPEKWKRLVDVCAELHNDTIAWLDLAYEKLIIALSAVQQLQVYANACGWNAVAGPGVTLDQLPASINMCASSGTAIPVQRNPNY